MEIIQSGSKMNEAMQQLERNEGYLAADPDNLDLLARVIDLSFATGQPERAERHAEAALSHHPNDDFMQARLGSAYLAQCKWARAEALFAALLTRHADINLAYNLAYARLWQNRHAEAYAAMEPYLETAALSAPMATLLVRVLHHLGEGERAIALVEAHMRDCDADAVFLAAASLVYFDAGRLEEADRLSRNAQALAMPQRLPPEALVTAGSLALARMDSDVATAIFQQVLEINPAEGRSWSGLGTASLLNRDLPAAQQQLEQAVKLMPSHIGSWHLLAWSRLLDGKLDGARSAFEAALGLDRNFGESHGGLAAVLALQGRRSEAEASIALAIGLDNSGLSARYAQMILAGETDDPVRFRALAMRLVSTREGAFGQNLGDVLGRYEPK